MASPYRSSDHRLFPCLEPSLQHLRRAIRRAFEQPRRNPAQRYFQSATPTGVLLACEGSDANAHEPVFGRALQVGTEQLRSGTCLILGGVQSELKKQLPFSTKCNDGNLSQLGVHFNGFEL
jgi:hypothetical protein